MHIITVPVTFLQLKYSFNDTKEGFVNRIRSTFLKKSQKGSNLFLRRACFGWVDRSTANQHFFKTGLSDKHTLMLL